MLLSTSQCAKYTNAVAVAAAGDGGGALANTTSSANTSANGTANESASLILILYRSKHCRDSPGESQSRASGD
ncbi:hypothetical protein MPDQ_006034 [Monascus purpureus]|uniref:Uncharacterized protein n=1 Tax=Monascus purpureus TaxID=5098 RepID=A0A507QYU1_MONPU|nr:hypothetical protein MPDQ_006034 [Monascus purpureus]